MVRNKPMILGVEPSSAQTGSDPFDVSTGHLLVKHAGCQNLLELREHFHLYDLYRDAEYKDPIMAVRRFQTTWCWFAPVVILMGLEVYIPFRDAYGYQLEEFVFSRCRLSTHRGIAEIWVTRIPHPSLNNTHFNKFDAARLQTTLKQALNLAVEESAT